MRLILASSSPRRRELLKKLGLPFNVVASHADENLSAASPLQTARKIALRKTRSVAEQYPEFLIVGADTVVALGSRIFGKPKDKKEAVRILKTLRGRWHRVITGLALEQSGRLHKSHEVTHVRMRKYKDEEIERFVRSGRAMDKAGAYAIQDRIFRPVEAYRGCFTNVIGLPLARLADSLKTMGIKAPRRYFGFSCQCCR